MTYLYLWRAHRMYPCACYPSTWVSENKFRKTKNSAWNNSSNLWRQLQQDFEIKFEWPTFGKKKHQNRNHKLLCQIKVYLENFKLRNQILPKERMITILGNRHCINTITKCGIITYSCNKFHVIWRTINFLSKFAQKLL